MYIDNFIFLIYIWTECKATEYKFLDAFLFKRPISALASALKQIKNVDTFLPFKENTPIEITPTPFSGIMTFLTIPRFKSQ